MGSIFQADSIFDGPGGQIQTKKPKSCKNIILEIIVVEGATIVVEGATAVVEEAPLLIPANSMNPDICTDSRPSRANVWGYSVQAYWLSRHFRAKSLHVCENAAFSVVCRKGC